MKLSLLFSFLLVCTVIHQSTAAVRVVELGTRSNRTIVKQNKSHKTPQLSRKQKRQRRKALRKQLRKDLKARLKNRPDPTGLKYDYRRNDPLAIITVACLFSPILIALSPIFTTLTLILASLSPVIGLVSLGRINNNPHKYKGKGLAWLPIFLLLIFVVLVIVLFLTYDFS